MSATTKSTSPAIVIRPSGELSGEAAYLALLRRVLDRGERRDDRTGVGTLSLFGAQLRFDLREGFPLLTTKKVPFGSIVRELLWFLRGATNIHDDLAEHTAIWNAWADEDGDLGPIYGFQWRRWGAAPASWRQWQLGTQELVDLDADISARLRTPRKEMGDTDILRRAKLAVHEAIGRREQAGGIDGVDQIAEVIRTLQTNPSSRRIIVSAWNVADVPRMRLPPCHLLFQFYVHDGHLDCQMYQRSADLALGVPFNIASYALLTSMIARECRLVPRHFIHTFGDAHVYLNHVEGIRLQLGRAPLALPRLVLSDKPVLAQTFDDVALEGYEHHPAIKFQVAV